jgi:hypothetical protein
LTGRMATFKDISAWPEQPWWNTGGTRNKKVYQCPDDGHLYYFKQSFNKGNRNYRYEFWSEVIASEIGQSLGFDILRYDVAMRNDVVGCISRSMIDPAKEELIEGGKYLTAFDNTFQPDDYSSRNRYDFQMIAATLGSFSREKYINNIIETMVFDALIGNSDRHQENWALVHVNSRMTESIGQLSKDVERGGLDRMPAWLRRIMALIMTPQGQLKSEVERARLLLPKETRFSPIYDSGCSFGRELQDSAIEQMLKDRERLKKYVTDGKCEIHWQQKKLRHFDILKRLMEEPERAEVVKQSVSKIDRGYDRNRVASMVNDIDIELKERMPSEALPQSRKDFICEVVHLRKSALVELIRA